VQEYSNLGKPLHLQEYHGVVAEATGSVAGRDQCGHAVGNEVGKTVLHTL
jgi:hypothetical protein